MNNCRTDDPNYHIDPNSQTMTPAEERAEEKKDFEARKENYEKFGSFMNHDTTLERIHITLEMINEDDKLRSFFAGLILSYATTEKDEAVSPVIWTHIDKACRKYANEMLESGQELPWRNE